MAARPVGPRRREERDRGPRLPPQHPTGLAVAKDGTTIVTRAVDVHFSGSRPGSPSRRSIRSIRLSVMPMRIGDDAAGRRLCKQPGGALSRSIVRQGRRSIDLLPAAENARQDGERQRRAEAESETVVARPAYGSECRDVDFRQQHAARLPHGNRSIAAQLYPAR